MTDELVDKVVSVIYDNDGMGGITDAWRPLCEAVARRAIIATLEEIREPTPDAFVEAAIEAQKKASFFPQQLLEGYRIIIDQLIKDIRALNPEKIDD